MKNNKKQKTQILSILLCTFILSFIGVISYKTHNTKNRLSEDIPAFLEEAIKINTGHLSEGIYYASGYKYDPEKQKIGEYETRVAIYADTTFTFRSRITDPGTSAFNGYQTFFLNTHDLSAKEIHHIYDSLLKEKNIHLESIIGITASYYTKLNDWTNDTTRIDINLRTEITNLGIYEDINYYAYMHYSFYTLWKLMPKTTIYTLFICNLLLGGLLIWWIIQRKKVIKNGIILRKDGNYQIKETIFYIKEKRLKANGSECKLTPQLFNLFMLFLLAENHRVSKTEIKKKFWNKSIDSTTNMTSTVSRLNTELKDVHCAYKIIRDPQNEEYYILSDSPNGNSSTAEN